MKKPHTHPKWPSCVAGLGWQHCLPAVSITAKCEFTGCAAVGSWSILPLQVKQLNMNIGRITLKECYLIELFLLRKCFFFKWTVELAQDWKVLCLTERLYKLMAAKTRCKGWGNSLPWMWLNRVQGQHTSILDKKSHTHSLPPGNTKQLRLLQFCLLIKVGPFCLPRLGLLQTASTVSILLIICSKEG